jgi:hypothetical protein
MTKAQAMGIVCDIAGRWGENAEEGFAERIRADMTDDQCLDIARRTFDNPDQYQVDGITTVRDLWRAIDLLSRGNL